MKRYIIILSSLISLSLVLIAYISYTHGERLEVTKESRIQLHPRDIAESGLALSLDAMISNTSSQPSQPFFVEFEITEKNLLKKVKANKFRSGTAKKTRVLKPHSTLTESYTVSLKEDLDKDSLRKIIENEAVKVNILNENGKIIKSNYITNLELDIRPENF